MNTSHDSIDDVLRSMDAAPATLTSDQQARGDALLASLTAHPRRRMARWVVPAAAASLLTVGALVWPWNPSTPRAFADWTATPGPVSAGLAEQAASECREAMRMDESAAVQVAEQRGSHVFVALRSATGIAECLAEADTGRVLGGTGAHGPESEPLGPRDADVAGPGLQSAPEGAFAFTRGRVGTEVAAVTIHAADLDVTATLANGEYIAWWPTKPATSEPVTTQISVDLTFTDGTTSRDHQSRPGMERPGPTELGRVTEGSGSRGFATGLVGSRVTGVTVHSDGVSTEAEVRDGTFTAAWDLPAGTPAAGPVPAVRYDVTLDDGTVLRDVVPLNR